jgi:hypothetical protein
MKTWHFYDLVSGEFSGQSFTGSDEALEYSLAHQAAQGTPVGAHEGAADYLCHKKCLSTGALLDHKPPVPYDGTDLTLWVWFWDKPTKRWTRRPRLKKLQLDRWLEIKAQRDAEIDAPLDTAWGLFDHDGPARSAIATTAAACAATGQAVSYTLADNSQVTLSPAQIASVAAASHARLQAARGRANVLRQAIAEARRAADLAQIGADPATPTSQA